MGDGAVLVALNVGTAEDRRHLDNCAVQQGYRKKTYKDANGKSVLVMISPGFIEGNWVLGECISGQLRPTTSTLIEFNRSGPRSGTVALSSGRYHAR